MSQLVGSLGRLAADVFRCADVKSRSTGAGLELGSTGVGLVPGPASAGFYPGSMGTGLALGYTGMILMTVSAGADLKSRSSEFFLKPWSMEGLLGNVVGLEPKSMEPSLGLGQACHLCPQNGLGLEFMETGLALGSLR